MDIFFPEIYSVMFLAAIQGIILGMIILAGKKGGRPANAAMAVLLFSFSFFIGMHSIAHIVYVPYITENHEFFMTAGLMSVGPLYYCYVRLLTDPELKIKKLLLRLLSFFLMPPILIAAYIFWPEDSGKEAFREILAILNFFISFIFVIQSVSSIIRYNRRISNHFSNLEKINLKWLKFLSSLLILFLILNIAVHFLLNKEAEGTFIWLILSLIIFLIGYTSMAQPEIFKKIRMVEDNGRTNKKYGKSVLTPQMTARYMLKLNSIMEKNKLYLDNNITLPRLSEETGIPVHFLSQMINESIGTNFYDYINSQRIKEASRLLLMPESPRIADIAFEAGFNTLSSFNANFRKHTGTTPSQFKKCKGGWR